MKWKENITVERTEIFTSIDTILVWLLVSPTSINIKGIK